MSHDPTEHAQEHIHHEASHGGGPKWITAAALTAAFLAAFAAVSSTAATTHLTQSTLKRIESNDTWMEYDADSIKRSNIYTRDQNWALAPVDKQTLITKQHDDDQKKKKEYATPIEDEANPAQPQGMAGIKKKAEELKDLSEEHLTTHETYELSATMFHIAIAVVAIAVVAKRKEFWAVSMVGGAVGVYFFISAYQHAPPAEHPEADHAAAAEHATGSAHAPEPKPAAEHTPAEGAKPPAGDPPATQHH